MSTQALPSMDSLVIGDHGETFGQLKERVLEHRSAFLSKLLRGEADDALMDAYNASVAALEAAYERVHLPYAAP